jgi:hypothetical protein
MPPKGKPETRRPKLERRPKSEARIDTRPTRLAALWLKAGLVFEFRVSFGFRVSAFGFQWRRLRPFGEISALHLGGQNRTPEPV